VEFGKRGGAFPSRWDSAFYAPPACAKLSPCHAGVLQHVNGLTPLTKASSCRTNLNRAGYGPRGNGCGDLRGRIDAKARRCEPAECDLAGARFVPLRAGLGFSVGLETKESWEGKRVRLSLPAAEAR